MAILRGFPPSNTVSTGGWNRTAAMTSKATYRVQNVSGKDIPMKIIRENGEMVEDVFRDNEVCMGLTAKTVAKLRTAFGYNVFSVTEIVEELRPVWMKEGF